MDIEGTFNGHSVHSAEAIEDADFRAVANPNNLIVLPAIPKPTRGLAIEHLSRMIPKNEFGLPIYYIRSDLLDLPSLLLYGSISRDEVDAASELINYADGYPTLNSGVPFWGRMTHEPDLNFRLFQRFLALNELEGIRLVDTLARLENIELPRILEYHKEFYWTARARAYDLFIVAAEAKKREALTRKAENNHYNTAGTILEKILARFENEGDELIEKLEGKELFDLFEQIVKIQRLSLGLTGQNASSTPKELTNPGQTVEFIMRNLLKNSGTNDQGGADIRSRLALLMGSEDTALSAQEIIIRATTDNAVNAKAVG